MARNPVKRFREFVAFMRAEPGMPYAEYPFRPADRGPKGS